MRLGRFKLVLKQYNALKLVPNFSVYNYLNLVHEFIVLLMIHIAVHLLMIQQECLQNKPWQIIG